MSVLDSLRKRSDSRTHAIACAYVTMRACTNQNCCSQERRRRTCCQSAYALLNTSSLRKSWKCAVWDDVSSLLQEVSTASPKQTMRLRGRTMKRHSSPLLFRSRLRKVKKGCFGGPALDGALLLAPAQKPINPPERVPCDLVSLAPERN